MEQVYDIVYEGFEHRVILNRKQIDPNVKPGPDNGFLGIENLPFPVVAAIFMGIGYPGLEYKEFTSLSSSG